MYDAKEGMRFPPNLDPRHLFDVNEIVRIVVQAHERRWKEAGTAFRIDLAENLPQIFIDPHELEQVLLVLVANAEHAISANVGRPGQIQLRTALQGQRLQVTVTDNGRGIHSREMAHLFDGQSRDTELTSCAGVIRDHGGELYAWSSYGNGSAFTIELPVSCVTVPCEAFEERVTQKGLHGKRILVRGEGVHLDIVDLLGVRQQRQRARAHHDAADLDFMQSAQRHALQRELGRGQQRVAQLRDVHRHPEALRHGLPGSRDVAAQRHEM